MGSRRFTSRPSRTRARSSGSSSANAPARRPARRTAARRFTSQPRRVPQSPPQSCWTATRRPPTRPPASAFPPWRSAATAARRRSRGRRSGATRPSSSCSSAPAPMLSTRISGVRPRCSSPPRADTRVARRCFSTRACGPRRWPRTPRLHCTRLVPRVARRSWSCSFRTARTCGAWRSEAACLSTPPRKRVARRRARCSSRTRQTRRREPTRTAPRSLTPPAVGTSRWWCN
mmetsp:Transcript_98134/g.300068  ORF Transcript_98134/g.300068 Transcript_98134/m.300068 type:complete len:231 (-) Transcript_98134:286-978(-)